MNKELLVNRKISFFLSVALFLCWGSCQQEEQQTAKLPVATSTENIDSCMSSVKLLLFLDSGLLEVWGKCPETYQKVATFPLKQPVDFPIGIYILERSSEGWQIQYPNEFYQLRTTVSENRVLSFQLWQGKWAYLEPYLNLASNSRVLVFPNDFRKEGQMKACFACPHWMAEMYGQLMVEWEKVGN